MENGHNDHRDYMVGNVYNPVNTYKHWALQAMPLRFIRIVYETFSKKLWIIHRKKDLEKGGIGFLFFKVLYF